MDPSSSEPHSQSIACVSRDRLRKYLSGWTDDPGTIEIETHLSRCATCEQTLTELEQESDSLLLPLREPSQTPIEQDPIIAQALDAAKQPTDKHEQPILEQDIVEQVIVEQVSSLVPPSSELGPYQLLEPLGRGGMGMVYLAKHRRLNKQVAIKLLPTIFVGTEAQTRFEREILAAGQLKHPSIVLATDAGQMGGIQYLVMEYVDGLDLGRLARATSSISIANVCEIGRQIALGLSFAHAAGMVHRDIKPSNVMLDVSGSIKILDFGLVLLDRWDGISSELTTIGQFLGTLDYMAPEQAERCGAVDYRADLYSLGATLFRLLCGRAPLAAAPNQSPLEKLRLLANHRPPSLKTLCPEAPEALVHLVDQLLSTNPNDRPPSAAHVAEQLANLAADADLAALLATALQRLPATATTLSPPLPHNPFAAPTARSHKPPPYRWLAAACLPFLFFAGYWIVLETSKGQLVIDSEVADVQVKILRNGEPVKDLDIQTGSTSTRLAADRYEIVIQSPSDSLSIDNDKFVLKNGQTIVARIQNKASTMDPLLPSPRLRREEPGVRGESLDSSQASSNPSPEAGKTNQIVYDGKTFDEWLFIFKTERNSKTLGDADDATRQLVTPARRDELDDARFELMQSSQLLNPTYIVDLAERPERNLTRLISILDTNLRGNREILPALFEQAILHDSPAWDPLWNWLDTRMASTDPANAITEDELNHRILNKTRSLGKYGSWSTLFNPKVTDHEVLRIRNQFTKRVLPLMKKSKKVKENFFSLPAAIVDTSSEEFVIRDLLQYGVDFLKDQENSTPEILLASLNLLHRLDKYDALPTATLRVVLDQFLARIVKQNYEMKVNDPTRTPLTEFEVDLGFPYSWIEFGGTREVETHRLLVPCILLHISRLGSDPNSTTGLQELVTATKVIHDEFRQRVIRQLRQGKANLRICIDRRDLNFVTSDGPYGLSSSSNTSHGQGGIAFVLHCWANQLLGTPLPSLFANTNAAQPQDSLSPQPFDPFLPSPGLRGEGPGEDPFLPSPRIRGEGPGVRVEATEQPVFEGKTYDEWFLILKTERAGTERPKIYEAIRVLRTPERDAELDIYLREMFLSRPDDMGEYQYLLTARPDQHLEWMLDILEKELPRRQPLLRNFIKWGCMSDGSSWDPLWSWLREQLSSEGPSKKICELELRNYFADGNGLWFLNNQSPFRERSSYEKAARVEKFINHLLSYVEVSTSLRESLFPKLALLIDENSPNDRAQKMVEYALELLSNRETSPYVQHVCLDLLVRFRKSEFVNSERLKSILNSYLTNLATIDLTTTFTDDGVISSPIPVFSSSIGKFIGLIPLSPRSTVQRSQIAMALCWISLLEANQKPVQGLQAIADATKEVHDEYEKYLLTEMLASVGQMGIQISWPDLEAVNGINFKYKSADRPKLLSFIVYEWAQQWLGSNLPDPFSGMTNGDLPPDAEERWVQYSALQIKKFDKNKDGKLTRDEWSASAGDFDSVDTNSDGTISLGEYYKSKKR